MKIASELEGKMPVPREAAEKRPPATKRKQVPMEEDEVPLQGRLVSRLDLESHIEWDEMRTQKTKEQHLCSSV
eukprot:3750969-Amphidinium_carterae.1